MERKNNLSSRMSISTISTNTKHLSTIHTTKLSTLITTRISSLHTRTNFLPMNLASISSSTLSELQQNAKNDHAQIGITFNDFASVFNNYNSTTDPTIKAAWAVIAQQKLNSFQEAYSSNRIGAYISTVTKVV